MNPRGRHPLRPLRTPLGASAEYLNAERKRKELIARRAQLEKLRQIAVNSNQWEIAYNLLSDILNVILEEYYLLDYQVNGEVGKPEQTTKT